MTKIKKSLLDAGITFIGMLVIFRHDATSSIYITAIYSFLMAVLVFTITYRGYDARKQAADEKLENRRSKQ